MPQSKTRSFADHPTNAETAGLASDGHDRLMNILGGMASIGQPTYSQAGQECGSTFVWGFGNAKGMPDQDGQVWDLLNNSKQVLFWNTNPIITTVRTNSGAFAANLYWYMKQLGKKIIVITPNYNEVASFFGREYESSTWIPIIPGTDAALGAAIAYVWIQEGTYDKNYLATHAIGFDEQSLPEGAPKNNSFMAYIDGSMDGTPKTPEWAEKITGIKAREIRALARQLASMPTMWSASHGGAQRGGYGHEFTRYTAVLLGMQGFGKPGVNIWDYCSAWPGQTLRNPSAAIDDAASKTYRSKSSKQWLLKYLLEEGITKPPVSWTGNSKVTGTGINEGIFQEFTYPVKGFSQIKMFYSSQHAFLNTCVRSPSMVKAFLSPNIEFAFTFSPWLGGTATFSDLVLPRTTNFEQVGIVNGGDDIHKFIMYTQKAIEPVGESKSDFDFTAALAQRLGILDEFLEGHTEEEINAEAYNTSKLVNIMSWEQFKEVGYIYAPSEAADPSYKPKEVANSWIYNKELGEGDLTTPSGKMEFFSQTIFKHKGVNDPGIHPVPKYYDRKYGAYSMLTQKYPLQCLTTHRIHREHAQMDNTAMVQECYKVYDKDGYPHEPIYMNPADAASRGIKDGDIVRVFNDVGATLCGAKLTKTILPGTTILYMGAQYEYLKPGDTTLDKAGCANIITHGEGMSEFARVYPDVDNLVQVELWKGSA
jgi:molybdopterin guanine dinucleotide-containing S/N-oxide reductase-like protein